VFGRGLYGYEEGWTIEVNPADVDELAEKARIDEPLESLVVEAKCRLEKEVGILPDELARKVGYLRKPMN